MYIYIYPVGARGGPNLDTFSAAREPRNSWKNASYRRNKQMKSCEGDPDDSCEGTPQQGAVTEGSLAAVEVPGLLRSSWNASPRRTGVLGTFSKYFRKASREKRGLRPGSFAVLKVCVPQKEANLAKIASVEPRFRRKNAIQKCANKWATSHIPFHRKNDFFRVVTPKKARLHRKSGFSELFQNLEGKSESEPHGEN